MRRRGRPQPPNPREPVPSVPTVGNAAGAPLRYGGLRAAPAPTKAYRMTILGLQARNSRPWRKNSKQRSPQITSAPSSRL